MTRVAICLSGQARTWRKTLPFWQGMFASHGDISFDVFFHLWDQNTGSMSHGSSPVSVPLDEAEQAEIVNHLGPMLYEFSPAIDVSAMLKESMERKCHPHPHNLSGGDPVLYRHAQQFYSLMRVAHLKRKHEIEQDFEYDICVRARTDLVFDNNPIADMALPLANTVYSVHNGFEERFNEYRLGDIFFYSDSLTFDRMALFFKSLSLMKESIYGQHVYPEIALMYHARFLGIEVQPMYNISPKIMRDARDFPDGKGLQSYETV